MELHESLRELAERMGTSVFTDPEGFRGALDDYLDEGVASTGDINLLVDAVRLGAYRSMTTMLASGAPPASAILEAGTMLARDRGSDDTHRARWACATLAYAIGRLGEAELRAYGGRSGQPPAAPPTVQGPPPPYQSPPFQSPPQPFQSSPQQPYQSPPQPPPPGATAYPPQPGAPQWQRPASSGPDPKKLMLIIGGCVGALLLVLIPLAVLLNGSGSGAETAAEDYLNAQIDRDWESECDLWSDDLREEKLDDYGADDCDAYADTVDGQFSGDYADAYDDAGLEFEIEKSEEDDDVVTVYYNYSWDYNGDDETTAEAVLPDGDLSGDDDGELELIEEDGAWKVDKDS